MSSAWILCAIGNHYEHSYDIRSSSTVFGFYIWSIASTSIILHTKHDLHVDDRFGSWLLSLFASILLFGFVVEAWPRGSTLVQRRSGASDYDKANIFSRMTFYFFQPIINIGLKRTLTVKDLQNLLQEKINSENGCKSLSAYWNARLLKSKTRNGLTPSLFWTVLRKQLAAYAPIMVCRLVIIALSYALPLLLSRLLTYLQEYEDKPLSYGIMLACAMFLVSLVVALLYTYNRYQMFLLSIAAKVALTSMIYRKALRLSPESRVKSTTGEVINHMAIDADSWSDSYIYFTNWIAIPVEIAVALLLLYRFLGWSMIAGVMGMFLLLPLQAWQAKMFETLQDKKLAAMDRRVRLTTEVLAGIKVVKIYGWESAFLERIKNLRDKELAALRTIGIVQAFMSIIFISSPLVISLITFGVYARWGGPDFTPGNLTPQTVFVSMTLFAMLRGPIANLSEATTSTISVMVGTRRIQEFLLREEVREDDIIRSRSVPRDPQEPLILIKDASFTWSTSTEVSDEEADEHDRLLPTHGLQQKSTEFKPTLQNINFSVANKSLIAIVGRIGQGKSSLLSAIIGEMYKCSGLVQVSGKLAYIPQHAWIINATLRDNIVFGAEYDEVRYKQVIFACGLEPDIAMLTEGDLTGIGERGINLSGGQKQRVSLARAVYQDADIYLLDDPLSAVDAHVDKHLWDHVIGPAGLLQNKARVLVTHGIHHLKDVNQVVVLKQGEITEQGHYNELMRLKGALYKLIKEHSFSPSKGAEKSIIPRKRSEQTPATRAEPELHAQTSILDAFASQTSSMTQGLESRSGSDSASFVEMATLENAPDLVYEGDEPVRVGRDIQPTDSRADDKDGSKPNKADVDRAEKSKEGQVGLGTALDYIRALSFGRFMAILMLFTLAQVCLVGTSMWLRHWIKMSEDNQNGGSGGSTPSVNLFLTVYALLTLLYVAAYVIASWLTFANARIRASALLHRNLSTKVLQLSMSFFDITPLGRILNRFSSDIATMDDRLPNKLFDTLYFGFSVASISMLVVYNTPSFIIVVPFLLAGFCIIQLCFMRISTAMVRIYSVSKSPVYQHFSESLNGISTIRAMQAHDRFIRENVQLSDTMGNCFLGYMLSKRWVEVQLRLLSTVVLLFATLFAVLDRSKVDPSLVGLVLSFTLSFTEDTTSLVRNFCDFQNTLVSVERVLEYTDLKSEAPAHTDVLIPPNWPGQGHIRFNNYSTRYREGLDLVISNISLEILPAQKIGIVGRTGAGKSSLTLALFRIIEAANSHWAKASDNMRTMQSDSTTASKVDPANESPEPLTETEGGEEGGSIEIDGLDISTIGLEDLRQHLAIIPQDPTLFAGTVRDNLDPFQQLEDADLWEALERSHLKEYIRSLPGGLTFEVAQNGENFSVGQRSLICLARALLRKTKVLVMDEATAAVDMETDELIQKTIRMAFKERTVLTIAHRIKTVMDSDKILVLERGRVAEFDTPGKLLRDENSFFFKLAKQAGEV
ncbi:Multidrug resistance-associated protein 1 [Mortierella alpina]|nr:Multidrug resistance-associated protein 1 [Mortierella alpina]